MRNYEAAIQTVPAKGRGVLHLRQRNRKTRKRNTRAWSNCRARIVMFSRVGYELRAKEGHVQYRILYFFHGRNGAILAHSLTKEDVIPRSDIERALRRK